MKRRSKSLNTHTRKSARQIASEANVVKEHGPTITRLKRKIDKLTRELHEAREQQTATAEVLESINRPSFDLSAILQIMVRTAARLCDAGPAEFFLLEGDVYKYWTGQNVTEAYRQHEKQAAIRAGRGTIVGRVAMEKRIVQIIDALEDLEYEDKEAARIENLHSMLGVPLLRDGQPIGVFALARSHVAPFSESQIRLVSTFANQAVIAIENARLFNEVQARTSDLQESLEQQIVTADVLKVISGSAFELGQVLQSVVSAAARLCRADQATIYREENGEYRWAADHSLAGDYACIERNVRIRPGTGTLTGRVALNRDTVQILDAWTDPLYEVKDDARVGGVHTMLGVPLLRDELPIGVIGLARRKIEPYTEKEIALVRTFADQAVIAIENARLFNETKEALERQTATADILKVIASSPSDVAPVFEAIVASANRLLGGFSSTVYRFIDGQAHLKAFTPTTPEADEILRSSFPRPVADLAAFRMTQAGEVMQIPDTEDPSYELKDIARARGYRSMLFAPLMNQGTSIGFIAVTRVQPGNFTGHHAQLLQTFADQAVIAIENVRLFEQVQERTRELSKSLDDLRTAQDRLIQTEKLASLGQLTAGIAHEIKNPLNFVNNFSALSVELTDELNDLLKQAALAEQLRKEVDELTGLLKDNLTKVVQHGKRADSIVKNMLLHSREGSGEHRPVEINAIVEESLNLAYHGARAEGRDFNITLERDFDHAGAADIYPQEITRALLNLISNGFYAATKRVAASGIGFEPTLKATTRNLGDKVEVRIRDNGMGIPPDIREKIFNPFFTTKPAGEGTGLGLSMSHDIVVKQHGGTIDVVTEPGSFTEFIVTLPRVMPAQAEAEGQRN
jgi:signal transduction histidine kinase